MRQFVVGLLVVSLVWWWWSGGKAAQGATDPAAAKNSVAAPAANVELGSLLGANEGAPASTPLPAGNGALAAKPDATARNAAIPFDPESLVARLGQRDPAAIAEAWRVLATTAGEHRQRIAEALQPAGEDFATLLGALGADNTFLHSADGRAAAGRALVAALQLQDAEAVASGSALLGLCLRGRIQKGDAEARAFIDDAYRQYRVRADRWICDPGNVARARSYTVVAGDSLARIASRFRKEGVMVEDGTLAVLNSIHNVNALQAGQKIKVPADPILAVLEKRSFSLAVYVGDALLRLYWVGHGENDKTPVTEFTVAEKQPRPEWTAPDGERYPYGHPKNILGEYFIKFRHDRYTGFGAHGTPMPETIGTMSSMGCIRMLAPDIAELFRLIPRGAKVVVRASESIR